MTPKTLVATNSPMLQLIPIQPSVQVHSYPGLVKVHAAPFSQGSLRHEFSEKEKMMKIQSDQQIIGRSNALLLIIKEYRNGHC